MEGGQTDRQKETLDRGRDRDTETEIGAGGVGRERAET